MTLRRHTAVLAVATLFAGCAPLQQAPLVYSSKVSVGVDVSATSTETPGVGVNVGYKQIDAAYVPVAVARKCELAGTEKLNCADPAFNILALNGDSNDEATEKDDPEQLKRQDELVATAVERVNDSQVKVRQATARLSRDEELAARLDERRAVYAQLKASGASDVEIEKARLDMLASEAAEARIASGKIELAAARGELNQAVSNNAEASQKYTRLAPTNKNGKRDAYSVFGSFEADTKAKAGSGTAEVGLVLGKVFSTGVASQNLTGGLAAYYARRGSEEAASRLPSSPAIACIGKAQELIAAVPEADRKDVAVAALNACGGGLPATLSSIP